ncbi:hypothetical protein BV898_13277 [Hypsibius exemplaris]|uniref:Nucleoporin NUP42 n=1 Tax=Hypsibius exemplaris TaxID=2072580 RepID=A0A1W0WBD4_HYPEX|nr:hypothetical protein BV898_13277 [Hypsibius exemplaris]
MVVCRYFLQPNGCRYGDQCRFDHVNDGYGEDPVYNSRGGGYQPRGNFQNTPRYPQHQPFRGARGGYEQHGPRGGAAAFGNISYRNPSPANYESPQQRFVTTSAPPPTTEAELLDDISFDIKTMWAQGTNSVFQKGKVWPFSSYSYISPDGEIRTDPLFGLVDYSMEELRVAAYTAKSADQNAIQAHIKEVETQGNKVRLMCTEVCNAADLPHSEGAKKIIAEVRAKAAQHEAAFRQTPTNQLPAFTGFQSPVYSSPLSQSSPQQQGFSSSPSPASGFAVQQVFASPQQNGTQQQPNAAAPSSRAGVYSDTNMLSAEDFLQFASPEFTQGKVPYRPPPRNLC